MPKFGVKACKAVTMRLIKLRFKLRACHFPYACFYVLVALAVLHVVGVALWGNPVPSPVIWQKESFDTLPKPALSRNATVRAFIATEIPRPKMILYWTGFFDRDDYYAGMGDTPFLKCPVPNCVTTKDRSSLNISDVLIFHPRNTNLSDMPSTRLPHQRWVLYNKEPPVYTSSLTDHQGLYNWTMTYRQDSDIYSPYGKMVPLREHKPIFTKKLDSKVQWIANLDEFRAHANKNLEIRFDYDSFIKAKRKGIAWIVSHCHTYGKREKYVKQLARYIPVDIYGKCGDLVCERNNSCLERIGREYKFYIAFENSVCLDYVTEKFFNALKKGVVPIVFGTEAHKKLGPPNSYIDADKFGSPKALAKFLRTVIENDEVYKKYLQWNENYKPVFHRAWCDLCKLLHDPELRNKKTVYKDIVHWWFQKGQCAAPKRFN